MAEEDAVVPYISRIATAALLLAPEPRTIASRPVEAIAERIWEGGALPVVVRVALEMEADVSVMPVRFED